MKETLDPFVETLTPAQMTQCEALTHKNTKILWSYVLMLSTTRTTNIPQLYVATSVVLATIRSVKALIKHMAKVNPIAAQMLKDTIKEDITKF